MKFSIISLGCKVNQIELETISKDLENYGYCFNEDLDNSRFVIINTCTVTQKADTKSLSTIRKYIKLPFISYVFVTGCYSELEKDLMIKVNSEKLKIVSQKDKDKLASIIDTVFMNEYGYHSHVPNYKSKWEAFKHSKNQVSSLMSNQAVFFTHTRAFIKIQDGCNAFCSYCRIPFARGAPVSRDFYDIIEQTKRIVANNIKEIVISGINIGTYFDKKHQKTFTDLMKNLLKFSGKTKIRISSIEPHSIKRDFFELINHPNLTPHIHLPLQATSDKILSSMKRRYNLQEFKDLIGNFYERRADFAISTDIIVGYPGETEHLFQEGLKFVKECGFNKIHVFPFSMRSFTKVEEDQELNEVIVADKVKKAHVKQMIELSKVLEKQQIEQLKNKEQDFILEQKLSLSDILSMKNYNKYLPFKFSPNDYDFFKGTSDFYVKGIATFKKGLKLTTGLRVKVNTFSTEPIVFTKK